MSLSVQERSDNLFYTLELLTRDVGDKWIQGVLFEPGGTPEYEAILQTTWLDLSSKGYIKSDSYWYLMTPHGWLTGNIRSGKNRSDLFQERIGKISAALKNLVKGRDTPQFPFVESVAVASGVPQGFICNVIDSKLFERCLRRRGAEWEARGRGQLIKVPIDFGLELI